MRTVYTLVLIGCVEPHMTTVEQHTLGSYASRVVALSPVAYWRLGDAPSSMTMQDIIRSTNGSYDDSVLRGAAGAIANDRDAAIVTGSFLVPSYGEVADHKIFSLTRDW